ALGGGRRGGGVVALRPAQLDVDRGGVDQVVAMGAARHRLEHRRAVEMAHPQAGEIGDHRRRGGEAEAGMQLYPVRGQREVAPGEELLPGGPEQAVGVVLHRCSSVLRRGTRPGRRWNVWLRGPGNNPGEGCRTPGVSPSRSTVEVRGPGSTPLLDTAGAGTEAGLAASGAPADPPPHD